jgi:hypothetical protein
MVSQPVLLASIRHPAPTTSASPSIASLFLINLWHLAFVTSKFGGISAHAAGFEELKQACYLALDIVASSPIESEALLRRIHDVGQLTVPESPPSSLSQSFYLLRICGTTRRGDHSGYSGVDRAPCMHKVSYVKDDKPCASRHFLDFWTTQSIVKHSKLLIPSS